MKAASPGSASPQRTHGQARAQRVGRERARAYRRACRARNGLWCQHVPHAVAGHDEKLAVVAQRNRAHPAHDSAPEQLKEPCLLPLPSGKRVRTGESESGTKHCLPRGSGGGGHGRGGADHARVPACVAKGARHRHAASPITRPAHAPLAIAALRQRAARGLDACALGTIVSVVVWREGHALVFAPGCAIGSDWVSDAPKRQGGSDGGRPLGSLGPVLAPGARCCNTPNKHPGSQGWFPREAQQGLKQNQNCPGNTLPDSAPCPVRD